jgi:CheY-specific phosphatase CheX
MAHNPEEWLAAAVEATNEFATTTLAFELRQGEDLPRLPENMTGCLVALVGQNESLQVGLASNTTGCETLARALFASDDPLSEDDISDAMGEIANIVAGGVKTRMVQKFGSIQLGLPIVMEGHLRLTERQRMAQRDVALGEVPVRLLVVCNRDG